MGPHKITSAWVSWPTFGWVVKELLYSTLVRKYGLNLILILFFYVCLTGYSRRVPQMARYGTFYSLLTKWLIQLSVCRVVVTVECAVWTCLLLWSSTVWSNWILFENFEHIFRFVGLMAYSSPTVCQRLTLSLTRETQLKYICFHPYFQITVYLGKRDFVDHVSHVEPIG